MRDRDLVILACIVVYLAMCIGIGLWAMRRTDSTRAFFAAEPAPDLPPDVEAVLDA
ncbi:MAG: hypothetical protein JRJ58_00935 [Deltaproteobacteria bacterium]|nr:hypothetical protein [Deltaproteobacteria bacterium]